MLAWSKRLRQLVTFDPKTLKDVCMPNTQENLKEAFAGESQANRRYVAYAQQAEKDGFPNVAR